MAIPELGARSYFLRERQIRKRQLLDVIKANRELPQQKMIGLFSMKTGLSFKKIEEYLTELEAAELIENVGGHWRIIEK